MISRRVQSACVALAALAVPLAFTSHGAAQSRPASAPVLPRALEPGVPQVEPLPFGDESIPPWVDVGDVPVPAWARSVAPNRTDAAFYAEPGRNDLRRGSAQLGARFPLFGTKRGPGCQGRWLGVGPYAWICSDVADYSGDEPVSPSLGSRPWLIDGADAIRPRRPGVRALPPLAPSDANDDGLPYRYFFAGSSGAYAYANLQNALDDSPDQELEQGFAVAIVEEKRAHNEAWGRTKKNRWIAMRELVPARPFLFRGELVEGGKLDVGWVTVDKANVYATEKAEKATGTRVRFEKIHVREEKGTGDKTMLRVDEGGVTGWMRAKDISRARLAPPPAEVGADKADAATERWIDVDLNQQSIVAYEGTKPVFASIVSTGKGPPKSDFATPVGVHRIWVKIFTTKMDNLEKEDVEKHYALEDVPWVQFFDKAVALHGAFWHHDFGHIHSHGCVNLAPLDARWLYAFTAPHLPIGWSAVYPTKGELGTVVRVR
jgi:lipoprotein-anchoring transpeptidase ErfK/SrfK